jgi:hypothetical protein
MSTHKYKLYYFFLIIIFACIFSNNKAKSSDIWDKSKIGASFEYHRENHTIDFEGLEEVGTCCRENLSGNGNSFIFTIDYGIKFLESGFHYFSIAYSNRNSLSTSSENEVINLDSIAILGTFRNNLTMNYNSIILKYTLYHDIIGTYGIGISTGYEFILDNDFEYHEKIIEPADRGYFPETGTRIRNLKTGTFNNLSKNAFHLGIYFSTELPLDTDFIWVAIPKIGFSSVIGSINKADSWTYNSIFLGLSVSGTIF